MKIKLHNNDNSDSIIYSGNTLEEIREQAKDRIKLSNWKDGWGEQID